VGENDATFVDNCENVIARTISPTRSARLSIQDTFQWRKVNTMAGEFMFTIYLHKKGPQATIPRAFYTPAYQIILVSKKKQFIQSVNVLCAGTINPYSQS